MKKKLDTLLNHLLTNNNFARFLLIMTIVNCGIFFTIIAVKKNWDILDYYPEETYENLEEEASRLLNNMDFKTSYEMHISYDNTSNRLTLILTSGENKVTANVADFGQPNESVKIVRDMNPPNDTVIFNVFLTIAFSFFFAIFDFFVLLIMCFVLWFIFLFVKD